MHDRYFEATELQEEVVEPNEESTPEFEGEEGEQGDGCLPFIGLLIVIAFLL